MSQESVVEAIDEAVKEKREECGRLRAENARLREAVEAFLEAYDEQFDEIVTAGMLRPLRTALGGGAINGEKRA